LGDLDPYLVVSREDCPDSSDHCWANRNPSKDKNRITPRVFNIVVDKYFNRTLAYFCPERKKFFYGDTPEAIVVQSLLCNSLLARLATARACFSLSISGIQELFSKYYGVYISRGYIVSLLEEAALTLRPIYLEALDHLKTGPILYLFCTYSVH
jgi:hypothetical protein